MSDKLRFIHQDSGSTEWYTPSDIIEAARAVLGGIDLDPASSVAANLTVRADRFFTESDNGLAHPWEGRVWLNPPFTENARFIPKIVAEYEAGRVTAACVLTFASLDTKWARLLAEYPRWYPVGRVAYVPARATAGANSPPKASMVTYLGPWSNLFAGAFTHRLGGWVDVPYEFHRREMESRS